MSTQQGGLTETEKRDNVIRLAFGGDRARFEEFLAAIRKVAPPGTTVVLRGSAVTGRRWKDGARFDADGAGTSDLDLTFVGHKALEFFTITGFFVPSSRTWCCSKCRERTDRCGCSPTTSGLAA
jgi:hypothetical protein